MKVSSFAILLCRVSLAAAAATPATQTAGGDTWQTIRDHQPAGLFLNLTLPKEHFFQGEVIDGTIEISNLSQTPYHLWTGEVDRAGRISGFAFFAADMNGRPVTDPLKWASVALQDLGGMGRNQDLGTWETTLPIAYWLRFDQPGTYTLYAWSNRAQTGSIAVPLVSNKVTITIAPRTPGQEQKTLAEAAAKLTGVPKPGMNMTGHSDRLEGALELNALQTPSAREILRTLLSDQDESGASNAAAMGLMEAPDPRAEAKTLLAEVSAGRLPVWIQTEWTYSWMERYDLPEGSSAQFAQEHTAAFQRVIDAGLQATGSHGPAYAQALWIQYQSNLANPKIATYRALLAAHQLELSQENKDEILRSWYFELREKHRVFPPGYTATPDDLPHLDGEDFLPLVRESLSTPLPPLPPSPTEAEKRARNERQEFKDYSLIILANMKPDEARPLIVKDLESENSSLFSNFPAFPAWNDPENALVLPVVPLPELDAIFRKKLAVPHLYLDPLIEVIDRYGSADLVPDVLRAYDPEEGRHNYIIRDTLIRYLQRADPSKIKDVAP